jgi:hypothetical protein
MSVFREGIHRVRVLVLPDGIAPDGAPAAVSRAALVTWCSAREGMFHQVYVNGRFGGATVDAQQRRLVVHGPSSFQAAVRVEVIAVAPRDAQVDFADRLAPPAPGSGRVRLTLLRSQALPGEARANFYLDHGTGDIDYRRPLNISPVPIWACPQDKAGFGTAQFGTGDFGYDSAAAVGFGKGSFGRGQFGLDADTLEWTSPVLPLGRYRFGVRLVDRWGKESPAGETQAVCVIPAARPAARLDLVAFHPQTGQLTLSVSDHPGKRG